MRTFDFLVLNTSRYPRGIAIVHGDRRISYLELNQRVNRLAHHLLDLGVEKSDRVGFLFQNSLEFVEVLFAVQKIGAVAVPLNFRMVAREIKWMLDSAQCKVFIYAELFSKVVSAVKNDFTTVASLVFSGQEAPSGEHSYEAFVGEGEVDEPSVAVRPEDPAHIIFTGGTSGTPKGVVHTHSSAVFTTMSGLIRMHVSEPAEVQLNQVPMFHSAGLNLLLMNIATGGKFVIVETFDPAQILSLIEKEKATFLMLLPPATYVRLMDAPDFEKYDTSSVTKLLTAAGALSKPLAMRLLDAFPNSFFMYGWALTETGPGGTLHRVTREMVEKDPDILRSVGVEQPLVAVRLVDESGRDVETGQTGEAIVKGPTTMAEYFNRPGLTAETIKDGWVATGDLLRKDENGLYYFVDRKKDMIKSGGENVFAQEVEEIIMSHPAVEICAVFGVPEPRLMEAVTAVVKLRQKQSATEEEIVRHCREQLSDYKKPRKVIFVDGLPISAAGKIQKFKLVEQYRNLYQEAE